MIEQYFQSLLAVLAESPLIEKPQLNFEKRAETVGFIRGEIEFRDGSQLHFRELIDLRLPLRQVMYAYHYQNPNGEIVFRYDNTAHHMVVTSFPHHKHLQDGEVIASAPPTLEVILREIERLMG